MRPGETAFILRPLCRRSIPECFFTGVGKFTPSSLFPSLLELSEFALPAAFFPASWFEMLDDSCNSIKFCSSSVIDAPEEDTLTTGTGAAVVGTLSILVGGGTFTPVTAEDYSNVSTAANWPGFWDGAVLVFFGDLPGVLGELAFDAVLFIGGGRWRFVGSLLICDGKAWLPDFRPSCCCLCPWLLEGLDMVYDWKNQIINQTKNETKNQLKQR